MPCSRSRRLLAALAAVAVAAAVAPVRPAGAHEARVVVAPGDTLSGIAAAHGVSVADLAGANGLGDAGLILPGTSLRLPGPGGATTAGGGRYLVATGDTLTSIAASHGVGVAALLAANAVADRNLVVAGTWLAIPAGGAPAAAAAPAASAAAPAAAPAPGNGPAIVAAYTVEPGDTLIAIAARFGVSVGAVAEANGIADAGLVVAGRTLDIPAPSSDLPATLAGNPSRLALMPVFDRWAGAYGVPGDLLKAVTWLESGWQNGVESSAGAIGIGQLLPVTVDFLEALAGEDMNPWAVEDNVRMSALYLRWLLDQTGGDTAEALAAYYQGLASVRTRGPYAETLAYVEAVGALRDRF